MNTTNQGPQRLYLLQLAIMGPGMPVPGYLIQTGNGINVLVDTGFPKSMIGETPGPQGRTIVMTTTNGTRASRTRSGTLGTSRPTKVP